MKPRLVRSRTDRMVSGVCGGLAAYLGIDSTWVRLAFLLLTVTQGIGFLVYLVLWIIMPEAGSEDLAQGQVIQVNTQEVAGKAREFADGVRDTVHGMPPRQAGIVAGVALIGLGIALLLNTWHIFAWLSFDRLWPLVLILGGIALLVSRIRGA